jgi:TRAP-type C4-dicarboxylate transport system permease small subunit
VFMQILTNIVMDILLLLMGFSFIYNAWDLWKHQWSLIDEIGCWFIACACIGGSILIWIW